MFRSNAVLLALVFVTAGVAQADNNFGIGLKAGTLGLGLEGSWQPLPYLDVRLGVNSFDYDDDGDQAGVPYKATLALDNYYVTGNFHFPLSPMRVTAGVYSNGNEFQMLNDQGTDLEIGGVNYPGAGIGTLTSVTSFGSTAPYFGIGFDFTLLNKVGLNFDLGVLWQGEPEVSLVADGLLADDFGFQTALEAERLELEDEMKNFKAWPVISVGFAYKF